MEMKTKFGRMYRSENGVKVWDAPEIAFLQALAQRQNDTLISLFDEQKQFGGLSAVDCPHGRYEGVDAIRNFADSWYSVFHAESGSVEVVNQIRSDAEAHWNLFLLSI